MESKVVLIVGVGALLLIQGVMGATTTEKDLEDYDLIQPFLDIRNESSHDPYHTWTVSNDSRFDDWFFYFTNLNNLSNSSHAQEFFNGKDLTGFYDGIGVWVAYNSTFPPYHGEPYPFLMGHQTTTWPNHTVGMRCYLHGSSEIWFDGNLMFPSAKSTRVMGWAWYNTTYSITYKLKIQLVTHDPDDFILLDKIEVLQQGPTTNPPNTSTASTPRLTDKVEDVPTTTPSSTTLEPPHQVSATTPSSTPDGSNGGTVYPYKFTSIMAVLWILMFYAFCPTHESF